MGKSKIYYYYYTLFNIKFNIKIYLYKIILFN